MINSKTLITGVLGHPASHSLSPVLHNFLFKKLNLNFVYLCFEIKPDDFSKFLSGIKTIPSFKGMNITLPYKIKITRYLNHISEEANLTGAVNTVVVKNQKWYGYNTDIPGLIEAIRYNFPKFKFKNKTAIVIGGGGAARAAVYALLKSKVRKVILLNRTYEKIKKIKQKFSKLFRNAEIEIYKLEYNILEKFSEIDLIINATSIGMKKSDKPIIDFSPARRWKETIFYDIVYVNPPTLMEREARRYGLKSKNGLDMLIFQALYSFYYWTNVNVDNSLIPSIRRVLLKEIKK